MMPSTCLLACPEGRAEFNRRKATGMETPPEVVARHTIDFGSETEDMTTDASSSESEVEGWLLALALAVPVMPVYF